MAKSKTLVLNRGLYLLRYDTGSDVGSPPVVLLRSEPGANEIICDPDENTPKLTKPGSALVVRALRSGSIRVEVAPAVAGGSIYCSVTIEPLSQAGLAGEQSNLPQYDKTSSGPSALSRAPATDPEALVPTHSQPGAPTSLDVSPAPTASNLYVVGHLALLGDVTVGADEWLGGPTAPSRIEGLSVNWLNQPEGVTLRYFAIGSGENAADARTVGSAEFAGSRGKARPIVHVGFELQGPAAGLYELHVEALFFGDTQRSAHGQNIVLSGMTGREPLVGLRLAIRDRNDGGLDVSSIPNPSKRIRLFKP